MRISQAFDAPRLYELFQSIVSRSGTLDRIKNEIVKPDQIMNVLDFGCGIGYHSEMFKSANYLGIEPLEACVAVANKKFANSRVKFQVGNHSHLKSFPDNSYDLVIAIGVLHHIDTEIFTIFVKEALRILKPGGRLTTFDPVFHKQQTKLSKLIVKQDRGTWVRTESGYVEVIESNFEGIIETKIYSKLLRIPYDHIAINAVKK